MAAGNVEGERRRTGVRILAVDDTATNLFALCAIVEPLGHEIVTVDSGEKALACAAESEFSLVLLDAMMPGMDGFETLRRLRQLPAFGDTPVVLLTAYEPESRIVENAFALGAADYIIKPISVEVLRAKIGVFVALQERRIALAAKDRSIAVLAHDLRSPLTTIAASAESLKRRDPSPERNREIADRILRAAKRMDRMTQDLLDFARIGAGGLPIEPVEVDLGKLCRDLVDEVRPQRPEGAVGVELDGDLRGRWDRERIYQGLANLLANAIKYGQGRIGVRARRLTSEVEVDVWNDGDPIPSDRIGRIFEPFERGEQGGTGLGLGLYIVREIARAHAGRVDVESSAGGGTVFRLILPIESAGRTRTAA